jgi:tetratricopeptide (TPR) repeat protein
MMVKNEEDFLEDALKSAQGWCDELIVVDTGSTDRTIEIAQDMGAVVSHFEWCDSFSLARNETLRRSTGEWIIVLDADERFRGPDPGSIRQYLKPGANHPWEALMLNVVNTNLDGTPVSSFFSVRVFPNDERLGYSGRVHNRFGPMIEGAPMIDAKRYIDLEVIHFGYDPQIYAARKKAARSLPLIEATVREEPENHQQRYYLGREYLLLDRVPEAVNELQRAFDGILQQDAGPIIESASHLMQALVRNGSESAEILRVGQQALTKHPSHPDLWFEVGRTMARNEDYANAANGLERALSCLDQSVFDGQVRLSHRRWEAHELLGGLYWELGRYPECYRNYLAAIPDKPADSGGWPPLLNSVCALAIELNDAEKLPGLLDRLLAHPEAPLGMFFFKLNQVANAQGVEAARAMLLDGRARCARMVDDDEYAAIAQRLGV